MSQDIPALLLYLKKIRSAESTVDAQLLQMLPDTITEHNL